MRIKHINKLIIAHLNINSLRNKFEFLVEFIRSKVNILMISETKIDESSPLGHLRLMTLMHHSGSIVIVMAEVLCLLYRKNYQLN